MIKIKYGPNPQCITEVVVTTRKQDNLVDLMKEIMRDGKNEVEGTPGTETQSSTPQQDQPSTSRNKKVKNQVQQSVSTSCRTDVSA